MNRIKILCCPHCIRKKAFSTLKNLNIHIGKEHPGQYKIDLSMISAS